MAPKVLKLTIKKDQKVVDDGLLVTIIHRPIKLSQVMMIFGTKGDIQKFFGAFFHFRS